MLKLTIYRIQNTLTIYRIQNTEYRGIVYDNQGEFEQAIIDYTKAIELNHDPLS